MQRHVLSVKSAAEPEPNRQLRSGNQSPSKSKSPSTSPLSSKTALASRVSTQQHGRASRFVSRFMDSILLRLPPAIGSELDISASAPSPRSPYYSSSLSNPSITDVVGGIQEILEADKRSLTAGPEKVQSLGIPEDPEAQVLEQVYTSDSSDSICDEDCQLPTTESTAVTWSPESFDDDSASSNSLLELPVEVFLRIIGFVEDKEVLVTMSGVSKDVRCFTLSESLWKPDLLRLSAECNIGTELLERSKDCPSYFRFCAINRWFSTYKEAKDLLEKLSPEKQSSTEERERFEVLASKMVPGISPWVQPQDYLEEVEMMLPKTIEVLQRKELDSIHVIIELTHGVHRYELLRQGKPAVLEFLIYNPTRRRPTITCETPNIYHPYLSASTKNLELPSSVLYPTEDSIISRSASETLQHLILTIQTIFTEMNAIASDFTL